MPQNKTDMKGEYLPINSVDIDVEGGSARASNSKKDRSSVGIGTGIGAAVLLFLAWLLFRTTTAPGGALEPVESDGILSLGKPKVTPPGRDLSGDGLFDAQGRYIMKDFDLKKPFSNFLPGLGGLWGLPLWTFYVNRGQGVCSFGIQNKDGAIAKYNSAEKVYQQAPFTGFRTFVRGRRVGGEEWNRMPFFPRGASANPPPSRRDMSIGMNGLEIVESDDAVALETKIEYRSVSDEDFPALIRRTTFTNLDTRKALDLEILDGLGKLFPGGLPNYNLDSMGRTMEAWMNVYNMDVNRTLPFFHVSQGTADTAQVQIVNDGHFVLSFIENADNQYSTDDLLRFVVDPRLVFGTDTTLTDASGFFNGRQGSFDEFMRSPQATTSRTPCAFAGTKQTLKPRGSLSIVSVYGHASDLNSFVNQIAPIILSKGFIPRQIAQADKLVDDMTSYVSTTTSSPVFDKYVRQDFLDNVLRGGFPVVLGDPAKPIIYHTYSRIHGDLERDYNNYQIDATYFSQGPGNFRDVNQNRRNDVMHIPAVKDFNIRMFLSFVQADGYNPLTVATTNLRLKPEDADEAIRAAGLPSQETDSPAKLKLLLTSPFRIGTLFQLIKAQKISIGVDHKEFLNAVLSRASQIPAAQYAQNGFWADHWTYTLDLFDSYDYVFPDKSANLLYDVDDIPFFMSPAIVQDRRDRYSLVPDEERPGKMTVRAYSAVCQWGDSSGCFPRERQNAMNEIFSDPDYVADVNGAGGIWQRSKLGKPMTVSAFSKFLILGSLKFSSLDPLGMGVEYEGGKPGWNDAMNGLPGLIGSGMPETFEMLRILKFLLKAVNRDNRSIKLPTECSDFLSSIHNLLVEFSSKISSASSPDDVAKVEFEFWDRSNIIREEYRGKIVSQFEGTEEEWSPSQLRAVLEAMVAKTEAGVRRAVAMTPEGMTPTYFYFECIDYELVTDDRPPVPPMVSRRPIVIPKAFEVRSVPLFLEGPTRHLKVMDSTEDKRTVFQLTKKSSLYDKFLKMFLISASLKGCLQGIGRMMAFSAGWLENESVWLHMSYKFYLEMLRAGLYDEFFEEIKTGLVPFMDNERYGRSPLEAASFIASSAFPDASLHGAGFLARLSGSTAEFLSIWIIMMAGHQPFYLDSQGVLCLKLKPVLPGWLFTRANTVTFTFLGTTVVTYHNALRSDTWTLEPKQATMVLNDGTIISAPDGVFRDEVAIASVRNQQAHSIDVFF